MTSMTPSMSLSQAAIATRGRLVGQDGSFAAVSTDTRTINNGDLFVALRGANFDGHEYVEQARQSGASSLMVDYQTDCELSQLVVEDTRTGYGLLASAWRDMVNPQIIALTGSNGKTTLKEMLAAILSVDRSVLATAGNLNNDIGVPATLLRLRNERVAVIEMGANHLGEIDYLTRMVRPDVAILNNAGRAHIGEFGSEENIARGKAEILRGLNERGVFVYHADSKWVSLWQDLAQDCSSVSFGLSEAADYRLLENSYQVNWNAHGFSSRFAIKEKSTGAIHDLSLQLVGRHNAMNATAAFAGAIQMGCSIESIRQGLAKLAPVKGRLKPMRGIAGQIVIDDSYNANPDSVEAAINVLSTAPGRRYLVLGDLAELGEQAQALHASLGMHAQKQGIDGVYTCGGLSQATSYAFGQAGLHYADREALVKALLQNTGEGDVLLIKGSRSSAMEYVVNAMAQPGDRLC